MSARKAGASYAVSLMFDGESSEAVLSSVRALASVTGNPRLVDGLVPAHMTLGMFHAEDGDVPALSEAFSAFAGRFQRSVRIPLAAPSFFRGSVAFLPAAEGGRAFEVLREMNASLHESLLPRFEPGGNGNYLPGRWLPHVALAVRLSEAQFALASEALGPNAVPALAVPTSVKAAAISLARRRPYSEILRAELSADVLSPEQRRAVMSKIRSVGTSPETELRSQLFRFGFRFRKNDRRLPGSPDVVLPRFRAVVFVNGCFWHAHGWDGSGGSSCCRKFRLPTTNPGFWLEKFARNVERDRRAVAELLADGWRVAVVWECSVTGRRRARRVRAVAEAVSLWLEEEFGEPYREF